VRVWALATEATTVN